MDTLRVEDSKVALKCKQCGGEVSLVKMGKNSGEWIYACHRCKQLYCLRFNSFTGQLLDFKFYYLESYDKLIKGEKNKRD